MMSDVTICLKKTTHFPLDGKRVLLLLVPNNRRQKVPISRNTVKDMESMAKEFLVKSSHFPMLLAFKNSGFYFFLHILNS